MRYALIVIGLFLLAAFFWLILTLRWIPACFAFVLGDLDEVAEVLGGER